MNSLSKTLRNIPVPLEYKRMLINNVIVPMACFGSEIFGMSEIRISYLKKVVNAGISAALNSKNYCRNRVYKEFDMVDVVVKAACSRARAFNKWSNSSRTIGELINSIFEFNHVHCVK